MFKSIPGNDQLIVSLSQEFRSVDGDLVTVKEDAKGRVEISLYGKTVYASKSWLSMIAHFEIYLQEATYEASTRLI